MQSASTEYFRKARGFLMDHGRLSDVPQLVVNPDDTAFTNLTSTCTNTQALNLHPVYLSADDAMQAVAAAASGDAVRVGTLREAASPRPPVAEWAGPMHSDEQGATRAASVSSASLDMLFVRACHMFLGHSDEAQSPNQRQGMQNAQQGVVAQTSWSARARLKAPPPTSHPPQRGLRGPHPHHHRPRSLHSHRVLCCREIPQ